METKDHKILAEYLAEIIMENFDFYSKKAFLIGCISPDINIFTYLKGNMKHKVLHGHNYENSKKTIEKFIKKLEKKQIWRWKDYYYLGKLIHYITDAFTYSHNDNFKGSLKEHILYEGKLHEKLVNLLKQKEELWILNKYRCKDVYNTFLTLHGEYENIIQGVHCDVYFIKNASLFIMSMVIDKCLSFFCI